MATVSCIIPMYNGAGVIAGALLSLQSQTLRDWNAVVVDDGSTDGQRGANLVRSIARMDPRIRLVQQPNAGLAAARNAGLDALLEAGVCGAFVHFLDCDDELRPTAFAELTAAAQRGLSPLTRCAYGGFSLRSRSTGRTLASVMPAAPVLDLDALLDTPFVVTHSLLFSLHAALAARFDPHVGKVEDYDCWFRMAEAGVRWQACHSEVCRYNIGPAADAPPAMSDDPAAMGRAALRVVQSAFARAAANPATARMASPVRGQILRERTALNWATRIVTAHALRHDGANLASGIEQARELLAEHGVDTTQRRCLDHWGHVGFASAVIAAVQTACGRELNPSGESAEMVAARAWWNALATDRQDAPDAGWTAVAAELAERTVAPLAVDRRVVRLVEASLNGPKQRVLLCGLGRNGRRLMELFRRRNVPVSVFDEAPHPIDLPENVQRTEDLRAALHDAVPVVTLAPPGDARFVEGHPVLNGAVRWSAVRAELAADAAGPAPSQDSTVTSAPAAPHRHAA